MTPLDAAAAVAGGEAKDQLKGCTSDIEKGSGYGPH